MITIFLGILLAYFQGYLLEAFTLSESHWIIGVGMYLGIIMFLNVWLVIWPNQKKVKSKRKNNQHIVWQEILFNLLHKKINKDPFCIQVEKAIKVLRHGDLTKIDYPKNQEKKSYLQKMLLKQLI